MIMICGMLRENEMMKASNSPHLKFAKPRSAMSAREYSNWQQTEASLQAQCEGLLSYHPELKVIRIPDIAWKVLQGNEKWKIITRSALSQWFGGMPDLVILMKSDGKFNACLAVELKVKKRKLRQSQKKWADILNVHRVERFEDFTELLDEFVGV